MSTIKGAGVAKPVVPALPLPAEPAIRAAFLQEDRLKELGAAIARGELGDTCGLTAFDFHVRVRDNAERILDGYRATGEAQARGEPITPAAQWLLDNNYVVEEATFQVKRDLPPRFYRQLPTIDLPTGGSVPRVLVLAWYYVAHSDSAVSAPMLKALVDGYQSVQPLSIGELWALPSLLRFVLVENMRRIAVRVKRARELRVAANNVADLVLASEDEKGRRDLLSGYEAHARDTTFATQLLYRLRDGSLNSGEALVWLEEQLEKAGSDAEAIILQEHQTLSAGNVTAGNIIRGLRLINDIEWPDWFEDVSRIDALLRERSDYAELDFKSRNQYRGEIEDLARHSGLSEYDVASRAVELAGRSHRPGEAATDQEGTDVGFFLVGDRREELEKAIGYKPPFSRRLLRAFRRSGWLGIAIPVLLLTAVLMLLAGMALHELGLPGWAIALLLVLFSVPASEGAVSFFNTVVLLFLKPSRLVGYEYKEGIPEEQRTLVVVPSLIGSRDDVDESVRNLEVHFLANMKGAVHFALLSDWPDSAVERTARDDEILQYARDEITRLNARHPSSDAPRFYLLHRRRLYNQSEGCWMGWERKRGKLHELNLLLRGDRDTTFLPPDHPLPPGIVYVMTLDADTRMTRDVVAGLVGKLAHPLNRPQIDGSGRRVVSGYSILQPRVTASLTTGDEASFFQRVFSANRGLDPYVFAVSDLYQDVFREGTFTGKGLYHVDAFEAALKGRIPENAVLSHDLLEGSYARCGLATDVELVEDYPTQYSVDASRHHRWARGDWQLLRYIFDPQSGVPALSRWKMVDNLRRSITPIFWVMASIAGWSLLPFTQAAQWQALLILSLFMSPTFDIVHAIIPKGGDVTARGHFNALWRDVAFGTALVALKIVLMAHSAWMMADAIIRTLYRLFISRRHLLEWTAASQAKKKNGNDLLSYYKLMYGAVIIAIVGVVIPVLADSTGTFVACFFMLFWAGSPAFAWLISRSAETEDRLRVADEDRVALRVAARRTWAYFETYVTAENNWLPPDNFQETPSPVVAARTSPTNIGVYLLSIVSARDFGWISLHEAARRIEQTMATLERMERFRGHLYNWYTTDTLKPLLPLYVSAVDSGNLAGHLVATAAACAEWAEAPSVHLQGEFDGVLDAVTILEESLRDLPDDRRQLRPLRQRLSDRIEGMRRAVETIKGQPEMASIRTLNLTVLAGEMRKLAAAIHAEARTTRSEILVEWAAKLQATCEAHVEDAHSDDRAVAALRAHLLDLRERTRRFAFEMDFSFLLRQDRKLLSIGYRISDHQLDEACYDLLASEARLTSLFGVAKGDLPTEHWFRLGRPIVEIGFKGALVSWSGSMFEYLMPPLVMKEPQGGILNQTNNLIILRQIRYGREKNIPWGISEAAYNARDREMTYQYTNFGVPGLGLKRGLGQNTVVAPYATLLAAQFMPHEAVKNLKRLAALGGLGRYGFHDAIDFTPQRVPEGATHVVVQNYMAHHQGMSIVAVANAIFEGRMRDRFHADPVIEAAELLLQEKAPRDIPIATTRTEADDRAVAEEVPTSSDTRLVLDPARSLPATNLMSNGRYSVMVTATGTGYSKWNDLAVTRWKGDPSEDRDGTFLFIRDVATGEWWSATPGPRSAEEEHCFTLFADDKATFTKQVGKLRSEVEVIVVAEANGEGRRITIHNESDVDQQLELTSYVEFALAPEASDSAHPVFSKMFVETEIGPGGDKIFATRRKRAANEPDVVAAHFVTEPAGSARDTEAETDRRAFIGRGRTIADSAAFDPGAVLGGTSGFTLDPIASLRRKVRVPANKKIQLTFWTVVGASRAEVEEAVSLLNYPDSFSRQAMLSWTRSQVQTRHIGLSLADASNVQRLARYLIYPDPGLRAPADMVASSLGKQSDLWPMAISGDFPIFAVRIGDVADLEIINEALRYQEYLRARGLLADLVIVNEQAASYVQDLQQAIESLCDNSRLRGHELGPRQHIFAVRRDLMDEPSYRTLLASARIVLHTRNGTILDQIERAEAHAIQVREQARPAEDQSVAQPSVSVLANRRIGGNDRVADGSGLKFWNGYGGFTEDGREYCVRLTGTRVTPQPWINVIANPKFGFHISAEGSAFTWSRISRDFQLTPWSNDPVSNRPGEAIYIYDHSSRRAFSPYAAVVRDPAVTYEARHGQGVSTFTARRGSILAEAIHLVDPEDPVRITRLRLRNTGSLPARLTVYGYIEWVLGNNRMRSGPTIVPARDAATGALLARNPYHLDFSDRTAFFAIDGDADSVTADRSEFIGVGGSVELPEVVKRGLPLSGRIEAGTDPCAAIARQVEIPAGSEVSILWLLGDASGEQEARALVERHRARDFDERLVRNREAWDAFLETIQIDTPDEAMNLLVNRWLPYQSLACRIRARSAFYQASGAFGFRDQLQDTLALLMHDPELARAQILNAASRQFPEGDVQHWWLPRTGAGVRTMISDDVVWLGYAVAHFVAVTGDVSILDEEVPFLTGPALKPGEHDAFFTPEPMREAVPVYEHAARGLDLAIARTAESGLPLILGGDWNDGMNRVGEGGKGDSVWLGWFLLATLRGIIPLARERGDKERADAWERHMHALAKALEKNGWDGEWYRRASYDDGTPLGSSRSDECRIDSIAQSWSVLAGGDREHASRAMDSAMRELVDKDLSIVRLFKPPFRDTEKEPGYIKSYPPGVRENGGQYTHAATWFVIALAGLGRADDAWACFQMLNPLNHALTEQDAERYRVEPYVVAADVYSEGSMAGRGGWTWYTGSAGWLYRAAVEGILGISRRGGRLLVEPALPGTWEGFEATLTLDGTQVHIVVSRDGEEGTPKVTVNGKPMPAKGFPLPGLASSTRLRKAAS